MSPASACGWWVVTCGGRRLCPLVSGEEPLPGLTRVNQEGCLSSSVMSKTVVWRRGKALTAALMFSFPFQGSMTPTEYALAKCYLPYEDTVLVTYCVAAGFLVVLMLVHSGLLVSPFLFGWNLLRKFKTT